MKPQVSFGLIADCQYADADDVEYIVTGTERWYYNYYRRSPEKLREAVDVFNQRQLDFVIHLGDFIDRDLNDADVLLKITSDLKAPLWHVMGNHDFTGSEGNVERVLSKYSLNNTYYQEHLNAYRFIILDTNEEGVIEHVQDSPEWKKGRALIDEMLKKGVPQAYDWNGALSETQLNWLRNELSNAQAAGEKVILFAHHPVFPPSGLNALNDSEVLDIIDEHDNVVAFVNGHNHNGGFGIRKGIPYVTLPGMLNGNTNAFGIARIYQDRLEIEGFGRVEDMVIQIS